MKVLFVGEGDHDIGKKTFGENDQRARGVVATLARRISPAIDADSSAISWTGVSRFLKDEEKKGSARDLERKGQAGKVKAAILKSARVYDCSGTVCVWDQEREKDRLSTLEHGQAKGLKLVDEDHKVVCGVAIESIEAWVLGDPQAIAEELGVEVDQVMKEYPKLKVEKLYNCSKKKNHQSKLLLERLANIKHREPSTDFREAVCERVDIDKLKKECPLGFAPFAAKMEQVFGT